MTLLIEVTKQFDKVIGLGYNFHAEAKVCNPFLLIFVSHEMPCCGYTKLVRIQFLFIVLIILAAHA